MMSVLCSERNLAPSHVSAGFAPGHVSDRSVRQVLLRLEPPSSPVSHVYWGAAVLKSTQQPSCVVVVEVLLGRGKCPCWDHQPKGE